MYPFRLVLGSLGWLGDGGLVAFPCLEAMHRIFSFSHRIQGEYYTKYVHTFLRLFSFASPRLIVFLIPAPFQCAVVFSV